MWTPKESAALAAGWSDPNKTIDEVATELNRSRSAVCARAHVMSLRKAQPPQPLPKLARVCGDVAAFEVIGDGGHYVLLDLDRAEWFSSNRWLIHNERGKRYVWAYTPRGEPHLKLHRALLDAPQNALVDHINGDGLDNRSANLRLATHAQNTHNSAPRKHARSQYKGVWLHVTGRYHGVVTGPDGHRYSIGYHDTEEQAAKAHDALVTLFRGEFAYCNLPNNRLTHAEIMEQPALRLCFERFGQ